MVGHVECPTVIYITVASYEVVESSVTRKGNKKAETVSKRENIKAYRSLLTTSWLVAKQSHDLQKKLL